MSQPWSEREVAAIVADYLAMLKHELLGQDYNKTQHRRNLLPLLDQRSEGSIERKHSNISATLIEMGMPYISGYKPLRNYQGILPVTVADHLAADTELQALLLGDADRTVSVPSVENLTGSSRRSTKPP